MNALADVLVQSLTSVAGRSLPGDVRAIGYLSGEVFHIRLYRAGCSVTMSVTDNQLERWCWGEEGGDEFVSDVQASLDRALCELDAVVGAYREALVRRAN